MGEETENVEPIVNGDRHHALARHALTVVPSLRAIAILKSAAEDVDQHREFFFGRLGGRPDVEVQAVLTHAVAPEPVVRTGSCPLHASRTKLIGIANALPVLNGLRFPPA